MILIYIAGPFRAPTAWEIEQNVRRAEEMGARVIQAGGYPVIPHANTRFFHGHGEDQIYLDGTLEVLLRCDGMILLDGWEKSSGSKVEKTKAEDYEIPILNLPNLSIGNASLSLWVGMMIWGIFVWKSL